MTRIGDEHVVQPGVVSITQSTELGTRLQRRGAGRARRTYAHAHGMLLHVDGSRLANAAAALDVGLRRAHGGRRGGRRQLRRDEGRAARGRARRLPRPVAARRAALPPQAVDAARVQDAVRVGAARGAADRRPVAARGEPCQRDGTAARGRRRGPRDDHPGGGGELRVRDPPARGDRPAPARSSASTCGTSTTGEVRWMCAWDTAEADVDAFAAAIVRVAGSPPN